MLTVAKIPRRRLYRLRSAGWQYCVKTHLTAQKVRDAKFFFLSAQVLKLALRLVPLGGSEEMKCKWKYLGTEVNGQNSVSRENWRKFKSAEWWLPRSSETDVHSYWLNRGGKGGEEQYIVCYRQFMWPLSTKLQINCKSMFYIQQATCCSPKYQHHYLYRYKKYNEYINGQRVSFAIKCIYIRRCIFTFM